MRHSDKSEEAQPLDPVAMTLAVWLGLIVGVTGFVRMSEHAAARAALNPPNTLPETEENLLFTARLMAFGG